MLDESHYVKNPQAQRTKAALELARRLPDERAAAGADRHADPEPARGAGGPAARAGPAQGLRQRRPAGAPVPQRGRRRPPALEPARALLRAPHQGAGAAPAAGQDPGHGAGAAVERERLPPGRGRRDRVAAVAADGPEDHGRQGGRRRPRRAAGAPEQPPPAGRRRQAAQRAGVDRGLPGVGRAAGGVRRARGHPEGGDRALPEGRAHPGRRLRGQAPGGGRRLPGPRRPAADRVLDEGRVTGHHADARVQRGVPGAGLDPGPPRPGRGPAAPDRPGQRGDRLVPAGARHHRRDDVRAAPAQARPDRRRDRRPGARRREDHRGGGARAARQALPAPARRCAHERPRGHGRAAVPGPGPAFGAADAGAFAASAWRRCCSC